MSDEADDPIENASSDEPKPKKKSNKKKRKKTGREIERVRELDDSGSERPRFLLSFPHDRDLDRLVAAFEAGDYATVREEAPALAARSSDPRVRDAALELRRRIDPDPLIRYLLLVSLALLGFLVLYVYTHKH
jgi:hypothetical protein